MIQHISRFNPYPKFGYGRVLVPFNTEVMIDTIEAVLKEAEDPKSYFRTCYRDSDWLILRYQRALEMPAERIIPYIEELKGSYIRHDMYVDDEGKYYVTDISFHNH